MDPGRFPKSNKRTQLSQALENLKIALTYYEKVYDYNNWYIADLKEAMGHCYMNFN